MNAAMQIGTINFRIEAGRGYMYLSSTFPVEGTKKLFTLTLHKTPWGITIYQEWVPFLIQKC